MTINARFTRFFKYGFSIWLLENEHIYRAFEQQALMLIAAGRTHYSARTIVENLVHQSRLYANQDEFKIGNDKAPDLARLFVIHHPQHAEFWEYRRKDWPEFLRAVREYEIELELGVADAA